MEKRNIRLEDLIKYYDLYNRSEGKSPATLLWYNQTLHSLLDWLEQTGRSVTLCSIDENTIREFILWFQGHVIHGHKIRVSSVNNYVRALRAFFNWLYHQGYNKKHVLQNVKPPRIPQVMVDTLSDEEIVRIMASQDRSTLTGSRNLAIIALFLDSGLRLSEMVGLKARDVYLEDQYVKVMGKGSKERMVSFGSTARNAVLHYLIKFRVEPVHSGVEEFFLTIDGYGMSKEGIRVVIRRAGAVAGVPRLHPHLCRHTYATNFLVNGGNVLLLKQNLGHTTLVMVDHYVHLATSRVAILSRDYSPLDRLNIRGLHQRRNGNKDNSLNVVPVFHRRHNGYNLENQNI